MIIDVPDTVLEGWALNATDIRSAAAMQLYAENRLDYDAALAVASINKAAFDRQLVGRGLSVQKYPAKRRAS